MLQLEAQTPHIFQLHIISFEGTYVKQAKDGRGSFLS